MYWYQRSNVEIKAKKARSGNDLVMIKRNRTGDGIET
jgi:hypothetical protein